MPENNRFEETVTVFRNYTLPETGMKLAGVVVEFGFSMNG